MDTIISVNPVHIQPPSEKPECIYCLDDKGFLLLNKKCHCKYHYHNMCEIKSIKTGHISCPICRHVFGSINYVKQHMIIHISGPTTIVNQNETPGPIRRIDYLMCFSAIVTIILFSIIPIIYYFKPD